MPSFDAIIVGTGQAGPALAARLAGAGRKVAVVERGAFGGTCVNDGCTPTKTLIASAYAAHMARRGREYGLKGNRKIIVDMKRVKARKDAVVATSAGNVEKWMRKNATVIKGDRKSTRLNSSHSQISYAVFCLKKKNKRKNKITFTQTLHYHPYLFSLSNKTAILIFLFIIYIFIYSTALN